MFYTTGVRINVLFIGTYDFIKYQVSINPLYA